MKTLVVEDDPDSRDLASLILRAEGHEVHLAPTVAEALRLGVAEASGFDLVIVDLGLPDQDGVDLIRQIRANPGIHPTVLVCSAYAGEHHRTQARAAGCDHFLAKPFKRQQLLDAVARARQGMIA